MKSKTLFLAGLALVIGFTGCAGIKDTMRVSQKNSQWNPVKRLTETKAEEAEPTVPDTLTVLWKESIYERPGSLPVRGFGGRVFFYDKNNNAVEANGELTVFGYDESIEGVERQAADKKFVFSKEELVSLKGDSGFGTSYSIWIPWDEVGGMRKTIALIPMFKTDEEMPRVIKSGQSLNVLHGTVAEKSEVSESKPYKVLGSSPAVVEKKSGSFQLDRAKPVDSSIAQVSYESKAIEKETSIKTSTIRMSPALAQRMASQSASKKNAYPLGGNWSGDSTEALRQAPAQKTQPKKEPTSSEWISNLKEQASKSESGTPRKVFGSPGSFGQ